MGHCSRQSSDSGEKHVSSVGVARAPRYPSSHHSHAMVARRSGVTIVVVVVKHLITIKWLQRGDWVGALLASYPHSTRWNPYSGAPLASNAARAR